MAAREKEKRNGKMVGEGVKRKGRGGNEFVGEAEYV
jgi:hypothetical protein